jgi:integrase
VDARNKPTLARHVIVYLGVFFNWCVDRDLIEASPTARVKAGAPLHSRERFLTDDELRVVLEALEPDAALRVFYGDVDLPPLADVARAYFRLLILTGQRRNEVAGMAWAELHDVDGEAPYWEIPGERAKNHRAHIVPLAPAAVTIIKRRWKVRNKSKLVLSATGKTPLTAFSHAKKMLDKRTAVICTTLGRPPLPPWRAHDLRRTMVTHLNEMGFLPHAIEATVNHVSGAAKAGVAGTYNRAAYLPERRAALEAWAEKVTALSSQSARPDPYAVRQ